MIQIGVELSSVLINVSVITVMALEKTHAWQITQMNGGCVNLIPYILEEKRFVETTGNNRKVA